MPHLDAHIGLRTNITATICPQGSKRQARPQVAGPKPRLYQDFLHQNTESPLLRAKFENQLKPFEMIHVARPCRFGLTSKCFVDFGSLVTNPKVSLSGVAVQTVFAACWEKQDDLTEEERRKFCSGMPSSSAASSQGQPRETPVLPGTAAWQVPQRKWPTSTFLPAPEEWLSGTLRGGRFEGSHPPQLLQPPQKTGQGMASPSRVLAGSCTD